MDARTTWGRVAARSGHGTSGYRADGSERQPPALNPWRPEELVPVYVCPHRVLEWPVLPWLRWAVRKGRLSVHALPQLQIQRMTEALETRVKADRVRDVLETGLFRTPFEADLFCTILGGHPTEVWGSEWLNRAQMEPVTANELIEMIGSDRSRLTKPTGARSIYRDRPKPIAVGLQGLRLYDRDEATAWADEVKERRRALMGAQRAKKRRSDRQRQVPREEASRAAS